MIGSFIPLFFIAVPVVTAFIAIVLFLSTRKRRPILGYTLSFWSLIYFLFFCGSLFAGNDPSGGIDVIEASDTAMGGIRLLLFALFALATLSSYICLKATGAASKH